MARGFLAMTRGASDITRLLKAWSGGDEAALEALMPLVYDELRRVARRHMRNERPDHTLEATALANEVYLRLLKVTEIDWRDRAHFFAVVAQMMRRLLVDAARARKRVKRAGRARRVAHSSAFDFDHLPDTSSVRDREIIEIDDALDVLEQMDSRKARVIELRFFGGLSVEDTAAALNVSPQTVMRDWKLARAWMTRELKKN
jgi:RNA polymerase sigma factor (TIGR02999 family)